MSSLYLSALHLQSSTQVARIFYNSRTFNKTLEIFYSFRWFRIILHDYVPAYIHHLLILCLYKSFSLKQKSQNSNDTCILNFHKKLFSWRSILLMTYKLKVNKNNNSNYVTVVFITYIIVGGIDHHSPHISSRALWA